MAESPIERLFRESAALLWPGTPKLRQAHPVRTDAGVKVIDFAVPELKLAVELESWAWHSGLGPDKVTADRQRERALERAGWRVVSFTGREVTASAARCVRETLKIAGLVPDPPRERRDRGDWPEVLDYEEMLWQCRKLCLRALTLAENRAFCAVSPPLILLDALGYWDAYPNRYLYTNCVQDFTFPDPDCEHPEARVECCTDYEKGDLHFFRADGLAGAHQWLACDACGLQFPRAGHEQEWLDCEKCPR